MKHLTEKQRYTISVMKQRGLNKLWIAKLNEKNATKLTHKTIEILKPLKRSLIKQQTSKENKFFNNE